MTNRERRQQARLVALDMYRKSSDILGAVLDGAQPAKELIKQAGKLTADANKLRKPKAAKAANSRRRVP
jgi:hypothetical protein